ncbi:hypothetical protein DCCM_1047 [Desulfocucumis palustris]|uniref:Uncharacterized protein n=1 Tax=Desulfocucumis palustris TaxID=1898651 RepID=A0A2L2XG36_9FIRM|nr:hypothetical protein DCCM_1047 [Desulfocucumis palustris]
MQGCAKKIDRKTRNRKMIRVKEKCDAFNYTIDLYFCH